MIQLLIFADVNMSSLTTFVKANMFVSSPPQINAS